MLKNDEPSRNGKCCAICTQHARAMHRSAGGRRGRHVSLDESRRHGALDGAGGNRNKKNRKNKKSRKSRTNKNKQNRQKKKSNNNKNVC